MDPYASAINPLTNIPTLVPRPGGGWLVNSSKFAQKPVFFRAEDYPLSLGASATKRTSLFCQADQGSDGDVEMYSLQGRGDGQYSVKLKWTLFARDLSNAPIESTLIFGSGQFPGRLLSPLYIKANTSLEVVCTDLSAGANDVHLEGTAFQVVNPEEHLGEGNAKLRKAALLDPNKHPFWLGMNDGAQATIADGTTTSYACTVPSHADFNCWGLLCRLSSITNEEDFKIEIFEGNRRRLMTNPVALTQVASRTSSVTGFSDGLVPAAGVPSYFPWTWLVRRGTDIIVRITNNTGGSRVFSLAFPGELVYHAESGRKLAMGSLAARVQ